MRRAESYKTVSYLPRSFVSAQPLEAGPQTTATIHSAFEALEAVRNLPSNRARFELQKRGLLDLALILELSEDGQDLSYNHIGHRSALVTAFGQEICQNLLGSSFNSAPSTPHGGNMFLKSYLDVINTGQPRHDHVRAIMRAPGLERFWIDYQRLVFSWMGDKGRPQLGIICSFTQETDIPFL